MDGGKLEARTVAAELNSRVPELKEAALWIVGRHPEWGGELTGYLGQRLAAKGLSAEGRERRPGARAYGVREPFLRRSATVPSSSLWPG